MPSILITGGSGKFGKVLIRSFLDKGWNVAYTATSQVRVDEINEEFKKTTKLKGFVANLLEPDSSNKLIRQILDANISVNYLVNNARSLSSLKIQPSGNTARIDFEQEFLLDVIVPYELSIACSSLESIDLRGIVNIGSIYGLVAATPRLYDDYLNQSPIQYGVSKAALGHLTKELAVRLAPKKIKVNCVAFGGVEGRVNSEFKERYSALTPMKSMLSEKDIPGSIHFLCSNESDKMTGQTLVIDGGWTIW